MIAICKGGAATWSGGATGAPNRTAACAAPAARNAAARSQTGARRGGAVALIEGSLRRRAPLARGSCRSGIDGRPERAALARFGHQWDADAAAGGEPIYRRHDRAVRRASVAAQMHDAILSREPSAHFVDETLKRNVVSAHPHASLTRDRDDERLAETQGRG
mgnify:CR=1 FL=1